ncbi:RidA family protein [Desulfobacula sp.]|uniref:RidA family protein n=1 Tax=Desulfobacula sp. TaxID=2593537 RepID=UPI0026264D70|nr:RidA family protein [Desulfobacula sp.]
MKKIIHTETAPAAIGPYSQAIEINGLLFVSGQIPLVPATGELVAGDIKAQTKQVIENLKSIVTSANYNFETVVKCTCFLTDMKDFAAFNEVYSSYFGSIVPARECVQVAGLPKDANVEISLICSQ